MQLTDLLHQTFGFPAFRANQEAVCRAATDGRDVLLVMPTGAGKSLCYQLPAVARGGTALRISESKRTRPTASRCLRSSSASAAVRRSPYASFVSRGAVD